MQENIYRCAKCGYFLIAEELDGHTCKKVVDYRIEGNTLWLGDGKMWYPRKLSPTNLNNQNKHPDNEHNHNCGCVRFLVGFHGCSGLVGRRST